MLLGMSYLAERFILCNCFPCQTLVDLAYLLQQKIPIGKMFCKYEQKNLSNLCERFDFEYLRPNPAKYKRQLPYQQLFMDIGTTARRRTFHDVPYKPDQVEAIKKVKELVHKQQMDGIFSDEIILKQLYHTKFKAKPCLAKLKELEQFHTSTEVKELTDIGLSKLEKGGVYTYGNCKLNHPLVFVRLDMYDMSLSIDENFNAFYYLLLIVMEFRMVPYYVQKFSMIIDFNNINITQVPFKMLLSFVSRVLLLYPGNSEKLFLFNCENFTLIWKMLSKFIPSHIIQKVHFVYKGKQKEIMLRYIDEDQLEQKYGGILPNLEKYWPPQLVEGNQKKEEVVQAEISKYFSLESINDFTTEKNCRNDCCECRIM